MTRRRIRNTYRAKVRFRNTAQKTRAVNVFPAVMRGGIRM